MVENEIPSVSQDFQVHQGESQNSRFSSMCRNPKVLEDNLATDQFLKLNFATEQDQIRSTKTFFKSTTKWSHWTSFFPTWQWFRCEWISPNRKERSSRDNLPRYQVQYSPQTRTAPPSRYLVHQVGHISSERRRKRSVHWDVNLRVGTDERRSFLKTSVGCGGRVCVDAGKG